MAATMAQEPSDFVTGKLLHFYQCGGPTEDSRDTFGQACMNDLDPEPISLADAQRIWTLQKQPLSPDDQASSTSFILRALGSGLLATKITKNTKMTWVETSERFVLCFLCSLWPFSVKEPLTAR